MLKVLNVNLTSDPQFFIDKGISSQDYLQSLFGTTARNISSSGSDIDYSFHFSTIINVDRAVSEYRYPQLLSHRLEANIKNLTLTLPSNKTTCGAGYTLDQFREFFDAVKGREGTFLFRCLLDYKCEYPFVNNSVNNTYQYGFLFAAPNTPSLGSTAQFFRFGKAYTHDGVTGYKTIYRVQHINNVYDALGNLIPPSEYTVWNFETNNNGTDYPAAYLERTSPTSPIPVYWDGYFYYLMRFKEPTVSIKQVAHQLYQIPELALESHTESESFPILDIDFPRQTSGIIRNLTLGEDLIQATTVFPSTSTKGKPFQTFNFSYNNEYTKVESTGLTDVVSRGQDNTITVENKKTNLLEVSLLLTQYIANKGRLLVFNYPYAGFGETTLPCRFDTDTLNLQVISWNPDTCNAIVAVEGLSFKVFDQVTEPYNPSGGGSGGGETYDGYSPIISKFLTSSLGTVNAQANATTLLGETTANARYSNQLFEFGTTPKLTLDSSGTERVNSLNGFTYILSSRKLQFPVGGGVGESMFGDGVTRSISSSWLFVVFKPETRVSNLPTYDLVGNTGLPNQGFDLGRIVLGGVDKPLFGFSTEHDFLLLWVRGAGNIQTNIALPQYDYSLIGIYCDTNTVTPTITLSVWTALQSYTNTVPDQAVGSYYEFTYTVPTGQVADFLEPTSDLRMSHEITFTPLIDGGILSSAAHAKLIKFVEYGRTMSNVQNFRNRGRDILNTASLAVNPLTTYNEPALGVIPGTPSCRVFQAAQSSFPNDTAASLLPTNVHNIALTSIVGTTTLGNESVNYGGTVGQQVFKSVNNSASVRFENFTQYVPATTNPFVFSSETTDVLTFTNIPDNPRTIRPGGQLSYTQAYLITAFTFNHLNLTGSHLVGETLLLGYPNIVGNPANPYFPSGSQTNGRFLEKLIKRAGFTLLRGGSVLSSNAYDAFLETYNNPSFNANHRFTVTMLAFKDTTIYPGINDTLYYLYVSKSTASGVKSPIASNRASFCKIVSFGQQGAAINTSSPLLPYTATPLPPMVEPSAFIKSRVDGQPTNGGLLYAEFGLNQGFTQAQILNHVRGVAEAYNQSTLAVPPISPSSASNIL